MALRKILFVFNGPIFGGAERHTFDLAQGLISYEFIPVIFAMKAGPLVAPDSIKMHQPPQPCSLKTRILDLAECIRVERPDVIVTVNERPVLASFIARKLAKSKIPIAAILHSTLLKSTKEKIFQLVYTPILNRIERVIFISANQRKYWLKQGMQPKSDVVILNGIDTSRFSLLAKAHHRATMRKSLSFVDTDLVIGLSAVMRAEKNHFQAVRMLERLQSENVQAKLLLVGDGALRGKIEAYVQAKGLEKHVVFTGMQSDVRPYIAAFDIGFICSVSVETLSLSALEIMAMGIPMVMSNIGGASEIIDDTTGRLFEAKDDEGFYNALKSLSSQDTSPKDLLPNNLRINAGNSSRTKVERLFNHSLMTKSYFKNLSDLVD